MDHQNGHGLAISLEDSKSFNMPRSDSGNIESQKNSSIENSSLHQSESKLALIEEIGENNDNFEESKHSHKSM